MTSTIELKNASVEFPIFNASTRSLKKAMLNIGTGGIIGKNAKDKNIVTALSDVSFSIKKGDRLALIGHNGAGKTTLLRVLAKIYEPTQGTAKIKGQVTPMFDVGLGIDPEATGYENIFIRATYLGLTKKEINKKLDDIVAFTELGDFLNMPVHTYSSGMNIRLSFAVCTCIRPEILLLDEWIGAGDARFIKKAQERLSSMIKSTNILVLASHNLELLKKWCNKAVWLEHGKMQEFGEIDQVIESYQNSLKK